ncbi:MAG TPA: glycosyl transferase [Burkholderiales bacterium]|nr:glycosyl transferase [Burkholderiales bacterium]
MLADRKALYALLGAWIAAGLFGHDPWKPDEAYTFGLVYHMLETGDWLVPTLAGEPFVEKPPLFFWTAAAFAKILGGVLPLHDAARLASAFYVSLTLLFTGLTARRLYGAALPAAVVLAGCLGYLQHAHQLITDNALMAGVAMGLYGLSASKAVWLGTGAGIAFLSKGLLGPGMLAVTAVALAAFPAWRQTWRTWPPALLAFAPWAIVWPWLLHRHSAALFHEWFWVNNFGRFTGEAGLGGVLDHLHYAKALVWFALPAWPLALWTLWQRQASAKALQLPAVAFFVMFVVLSAASSARTLYGLPLLVPLAVLAAAAVPAPFLRRALDWSGVGAAALLGLALWGGWIAFMAGWRPSMLEAQSPGFVPRWQPLALIVAAALTALWLYVVWREKSMSMRWLAGVTLAWGLAMTLWLPWLDHAKSYRGVIADMKTRVGEGCVASRGLTEPQRGMFHYFAGIRVPAGECRFLVVHTGSAQMPDVEAEWKPLWRGTRPGDNKEYFWLFER